MIRKIRPWLIRLYPTEWRARYADEFSLLLEECLHTPMDVLDVMAGAVDAHLRLLGGEKLGWRTMNMVNKLRTSILVVFCANIAFILAGMNLVGMMDDSPLIPAMQTNPLLAASWTVLQIGAVLALLAIVVGGMPIAVTVIRRVISGSRGDLRLLSVPILAFLILVVYGVFLFAVGNEWVSIPGVALRPVQPNQPFPLSNLILLLTGAVLFVLGAIASTIAVVKLVGRTGGEEQVFRLGGKMAAVRLYEFAFLPGLAASICMVAMLAATLALGFSAWSAMPQVFTGNYGTWGMKTIYNWGISVVVMAPAAVAAVWALLRGASARRREKTE
jgi:hypothetical protein